MIEGLQVNGAKPKPLVAGAPLVLVFAPFSYGAMRVQATTLQPCRVGVALPNGQSNFVLAGDPADTYVDRFKVGDREQMLSAAGLPLVAFAAFILSGALKIDPLERGMWLELTLQKRVRTPSSELSLCFVPLTFDER
jgi:hypothetical protein